MEENKIPVQTFNLAPSWEGILPALLAVHSDAGPEGRKEAFAQLKRMAQVADILASCIVKNPDGSKPTYKQVAEAAAHLFWEVVAFNYPEITTGDFPPFEHIEIDQAMEKAVKIWVDINQPYEEEE